MNGQPHEERNQAEYPRSTRFSRMVRAMFGARRALNWGVTLDSVPTCTDPSGRGICAGSIPYHATATGDLGMQGSLRPYPIVPTLEPIAGFQGEAFWRMQPFHTYGHPSGLGDWDFLRTPEAGGQ